MGYGSYLQQHYSTISCGSAYCTFYEVQLPGGAWFNSLGIMEYKSGQPQQAITKTAAIEAWKTVIETSPATGIYYTGE